jgi:DNA (cytosine-5)-methyltransferase 1
MQGKMLNGLDLFSGIGGLSIALQEWVRPIAYCEIDPHCQGILINQMGRSTLAIAPIWDDVRTLNKESGCFPSDTLDIIYGGFPCQDISIAGYGKGLEGERSGLFFEIVRLALEIKPPFIFLENVPAITSRGGLRVVREIAEMGYDCRWGIVSAEEVGASHRRDRWFLLARKISNTEGQRLQAGRFSLRKETRQSRPRVYIKYESWDEEPEDKFELVRVVNGLSCRIHRTRALGNAVVPLQAKTAFKILMGLN